MALAGQNVSNANNTAYADEQLEVSEATPVDTPFGEEGTGAQITGITDTRDALLDSQIQAEASTSGSLSAQQTNLQNAEAYLDEQISESSTSATPTSWPSGWAPSPGSKRSSTPGWRAIPSTASPRNRPADSAG